MRLAIQISGEFRQLQACLQTLRTYVFPGFGHFEIDIFVHTWRKEDEEGHGTGLAAFKPRSYFLEVYEDRTDLHTLPRAYSMFYSIQRANDARKEYEGIMEFKYDLVMRYRTDCIFSESVFHLIQPYLQERKPFLCIPRAKQIEICDGPVEADTEGLCDWFAIGTPELMDVYCGTYDSFREEGLPIVPETMLAFQLQLYGIPQQGFLKRPSFGFTLYAFKQSLKTPHGLEER
jgi:hypothetical protein